jgi:hypothetical protein
LSAAGLSLHAQNVTPKMVSKIDLSRFQAPIRFNFRDFRACCGAWCDSKASAADKSWDFPHFAVSFSFTNQRADSFLVSGVNLEAKV